MDLPHKPVRKRTKITPKLDDATYETISNFSMILESMDSSDPETRSSALEKLTLLTPVIRELALAKRGVVLAASKFPSLAEACKTLQVVYQQYTHSWSRSDLDPTNPQSSLSSSVDNVIEALQTSEYHLVDRSEASIRVIVELVILDRLNHLSDSEALQHLHLYPKADIKLTVNETTITGRADWLLCHDDPRDGIHSTLIAIEAKRSMEFSSADPQIATYLAAVQKSRANAEKIHRIAFGITTDSSQYRFWFLDSERRLFSSKTFDWRTEKALIIAWIDKMLADAIEASPLTTPVLQRNVSLRNWERNFRRQNLHSGSGIEDSPITEGLPFTIRVPDSARSLGEAWYHGMVVEVVEYNESEEE